MRLVAGLHRSDTARCNLELQYRHGLEYLPHRSALLFQTQIPLNPGSSGGPIFNRNGQVIGIVVAGVVDANNLNFGIRGDAILDSLRSQKAAMMAALLIAPAGVAIFRNGQVVSSTDLQRYRNETFGAIIKGKMVQKTAADIAFGAITFE